MNTKSLPVTLPTHVLVCIEIERPCTLVGYREIAGSVEELRVTVAPRTRRVVSVNERGHVVGQDHHRAKFSDHDVWLMQELRADGMALSEIAKKFETSKGLVHDLCSGRRRSHTAVAQRTLAPAKPRRRFTPASPDEFA